MCVMGFFYPVDQREHVCGKIVHGMCFIEEFTINMIVLTSCPVVQTVIHSEIDTKSKTQG